MLNDALICTAVLLLTNAVLAALGISKAGTIALAIALVLATWRLAAAGQDWLELGLRAPRSWWIVPVGAVVLIAAVALTNALAIAPLARICNWAPQDLGRFAAVRGNWAALAGFLALAWTSAAFGEEMFFRGFLLTRVAAAWGDGSASAPVAAIVVQAAVFGLAHAYLGLRGAVTAGVSGLVFGAAYILAGRNLWPLILAHGLIDTVGLIAVFMGRAA